MRTTHKILLVTGLTILLFSAFARADFELGLSYYKSSNFEKAYNEFFEAAQYGDYDAQNNIGAMYYRGEYLTKSVTSAYAWMALAAQAEEYKKAAVHNKLFARMSAADKKIAEAEYKKLFDQYSDAAIEKRLTPVFTNNLQSKKQRPIKIVPPEYPGSMLQQGKTGFVDTIYSIDKYGITRDHIVTYASSEAFAREALAALRQFQYEPMTVNSKPVNVNGIKNRFTFQISGNKHDNKKLNKLIDKKRQQAQTGTSQDKLGFAYFLETIPSRVPNFELKDNPNEWYISAANQGSSAASYFLGRNILYGDMCTQDTLQSMGWLLKAAKANVTDAQYMLAIESFSGSRFDKNDEKGFYWLKRAASRSSPAKIRHAWILATHPDARFRDGTLAAEELKSVPDNYTDKQSYYQTQAAVAAENNDFKQAVKWQKEALEDAQDLKLPLQVLEQQLANYSTQKPWREEI